MAKLSSWAVTPHQTIRLPDSNSITENSGALRPFYVLPERIDASLVASISLLARSIPFE